MIKKILMALVICFAIAINASAIKRNADSLNNENKMGHFVGVQANALVRQIFNFGNANNPINNPYLLTYSLLFTKHKLGVDIGLGYTKNGMLENDGNTKRKSNINDLYVRLGIQKLVPLNWRFTSTINFHVIYEKLYNATQTETSFNVQKSIFNTNTSSDRIGFGPCLGIRYKLGNRVFIGTECSYYYKMGNSKSHVVSYIQDPFTGQIQDYSDTQSNDDLTQFMLNVPTAIYLTLRF